MCSRTSVLNLLSKVAISYSAKEQKTSSNGMNWLSCSKACFIAVTTRLAFTFLLTISTDKSSGHILTKSSLIDCSQSINPELLSIYEIIVVCLTNLRLIISCFAMKFAIPRISSGVEPLSGEGKYPSNSL